MDDEDRWLKYYLILLLVGVFGACLLMCECVFLGIFLTPTNCFIHREFLAGAGEMTYCGIKPEDYDLVMSFNNEADNKKRTDSMTYLVAAPVKLNRTTRLIEETINGNEFNNSHYMFAGDFISGYVECSKNCNLEIYSKISKCQTDWNYGNYTKSNLMNKKWGFIGMTGRGRDCSKHYGSIKNASGTSFDFSAEATQEGAVYVKVTSDGSFSGKISYNLTQTKIDITKSKVVDKCNNYKCSFNSTTMARNSTYVVVNYFSDNMKGKYLMYGSYMVNKYGGYNACIGIGVATAALILAEIIILLIDFRAKLFPCLKKDESTPAGDKPTPNGPTPDGPTPDGPPPPDDTTNNVEMTAQI